MWCHNYVIDRNEYLIFTLPESSNPCVYSLQFLFKSTNNSWRYERKREWVFFFWTQCIYTAHKWSPWLTTGSLISVIISTLLLPVITIITVISRSGGGWWRHVLASLHGPSSRVVDSSLRSILHNHITSHPGRVTPLWTWRGEFLNLAYPRPILSKFYSILSLLTYCELKLVPLQSGYDVTHLSSDRCYTPKIYI